MVVRREEMVFCGKGKAGDIKSEREILSFFLGEALIFGGRYGLCQNSKK